MAKFLDGKVAVITGAARGMGEATARRFVEEGARVVLADVLDEQGEAVAQSLGSAAQFRHTDVTQPGEVQSLVDAAVETFGGLDIMFSNAGTMGTMQPNFLEEDFHSFQKTVEINLLGPLLGASCAGRYMARSGGGSILTTASSSSLYGGYGIIPYRATKAGVVGMTKSLAVELGKYGIRVNCISPGPTRTPMTAAMEGVPEDRLEELADIAMECMRGRMPLGRLGMPEDIANAAVFLASDLAAQITGVDLAVDGGETLGNMENTAEVIQQRIMEVLG
ncbi:MAG: SDR family oxidoreductase [Halieaceae bacterium]|nr:SDR family oxidoreductase [Halieaceae bacterium]